MVKLIYIDDDVMLGQVIVMGLEHQGVNVQYATSFGALESMVRNFHPDVLLLDLEVHEQNGIDEMSKLRKYAPDIPVLFLSSHVESNYATEAVKAGADVYLRKPVDIEELMAYINRYAGAGADNPEPRCVPLGRFTYNLDDDALIDNGTKVSLPNKEKRVLRKLVENLGNIVMRETVCKELWPDGNASNDSLNNYISHLRRVISSEPCIEIQTLPKRGFRLLLIHNS